jgi:hypothetical protein
MTEAKQWIGIAAGLTIAAVTIVLVFWWISPMREIERSRAAVARAKSWHYHMERIQPGEPAGTIESFDKDTFCPSFQRTIQRGIGYNGLPATLEYLNYRGALYSHAGDRWLNRRGQPADGKEEGDVPIFECIKVIIGGDDNSLPFEEILNEGKVQRGSSRTVNGEPCRDYEISVPTIEDPSEKEFRFTMCINSHDHLPRETRRMQPGSAREGASEFTEWNRYAEPPLPADFPR